MMRDKGLKGVDLAQIVALLETASQAADEFRETGEKEPLEQLARDLMMLNCLVIGIEHTIPDGRPEAPFSVSLVVGDEDQCTWATNNAREHVAPLLEMLLNDVRETH